MIYENPAGNCTHGGIFLVPGGGHKDEINVSAERHLPHGGACRASVGFARLRGGVPPAPMLRQPGGRSNTRFATWRQR